MSGAGKQWYLSKTIWANLLTLFGAASVALFGFDLKISDEDTEAVAVAAVAVVNIVLRLLTTQPLQANGGEDRTTSELDMGTGGKL